MEVEARNSMSLCQIYSPIVIGATLTNFKMLSQWTHMQWPKNFRVASSKTPMEEFILWKGCRPQSYNFTEDWVPFRNYFKSVSRIIGRRKSSRIEDMIIALTSLLASWMLHTTRFFYNNNFYKKMNLKNPKTLRKCW